MTILLTAFDPFGGDSGNSSQQVLEALPERIAGAELARLLLPTAFRASRELAIRAAEELRPAAIVCLGQAAGRDAVTPERVAVNVMDARLPDNEGFQPVDVPVIPGGPAAYFSTLPIKAMAAAMLAVGVPARISDSAGTYVCNSLMYSLLHHTALRAPETRCGFLHIPLLGDPSGPGERPRLDRAAAVRGIAAALEVLARG